MSSLPTVSVGKERLLSVTECSAEDPQESANTAATVRRIWRVSIPIDYYHRPTSSQIASSRPLNFPRASCAAQRACSESRLYHHLVSLAVGPVQLIENAELRTNLGPSQVPLEVHFCGRNRRATFPFPRSTRTARAIAAELRRELEAGIRAHGCRD